ncbi:hypothetical protein RF11_13394 [Thelohanellus kitauei]|uniref:Uncharacterized protein n=1 Tax=Thelohanellus kitauei TaxID=669202 RepID=A0A0C2MEQ5_THEKT|nr:hypothetical protein RF11_13394 [Thelohanellus kitauei]
MFYILQNFKNPVKKLSVTQITVVQCVLTIFQFFFNNELWFHHNYVKPTLLVNTSNPMCQPKTVGFYVETYSGSEVKSLRSNLSDRDDFLLIVFTGVIYAMIISKFVSLIVFMVKRVDFCLFATGSLHLLMLVINFGVMASYTRVINDLHDDYQHMCEISYSSFVTFWPMYMIMVSLIEITIFVSFHFSITLNPFKLDVDLERLKKKSPRCETFNNILRNSDGNEPNAVAV